MTAGEIARQLPKVLQLRFDSLGSYVKVLVAEEQARRHPHRADLPKDQIEFIQLLALVYSLDEFFRAGTHAARSAAQQFESLHCRGFAVGSEEFTPANEATLRGEHLAEGLRRALEGTHYVEIIANASGLTALIKRLVREALGE